MKYSLSEKKVLNKLRIPDFRHMTRDKVMSFASMLQRMDPEVAKKALEQFPNFKDLAIDIVTHYKAIVEKVFEENRISQQAFYDACNSILESLKKELDNNEIDSEERDRIENKMIEVAGMIAEKDRENKEMNLKIIKIISGVFVVIGIISASLLGSKIRVSNGNNWEDDADEDANNNIDG